MRVVVICFSTILLISSCKINNNEVINKAISTVINEILYDACNLDSNNNAYETKHITLSKELILFDTLRKDIKLANFSLQDFMAKSRNIDYDLKSLQKLKNVKIHLVDEELITNKARLPFVENIHFQYHSLYGSNYCKSIILSIPRTLINNKSDCKILLKAIRYYEYPIEESYYLIEIVNNKVTFDQLELISDKIMLH